MKVFSKELFIKTHGFESYERNKEWVNKCDGLTIEETAKIGFTLLPDWLIEKEDNNCLHCGKNSKEYCESCYQELISENAKLQLEVDNYEILQGEMDRIGIDTLGLEPGMSTDDVVEEIKNLKKEIKELNILLKQQSRDIGYMVLNYISKDKIRDFIKVESKEGTYNFKTISAKRLKEFLEE